MALLVYRTGTCFPVASVPHRVLQGSCKGHVESMLGYRTDSARKEQTPAEVLLGFCKGPVPSRTGAKSISHFWWIHENYSKCIVYHSTHNRLSHILSIWTVDPSKPIKTIGNQCLYCTLGVVM